MPESEGNAEKVIKQVNYKAADLITGLDLGHKQQITWTFSIDEEEEHTVILLWDIGSGKRQVISDGTLVYEEVKNGTYFQCQWENKSGDLKLHIVASSHVPPARQKFFQFELIINGLRFATMPRQDGKPVAPLEGPGPHGTFDIIYPSGYQKLSPRDRDTKQPLRKRISKGLKKVKPNKRKSAFF